MKNPILWKNVRKFFYYHKIVFILFLINACLLGCEDKKDENLQHYVNAVQTRPVALLPDLPVITLHKPYFYSSAQLRDPFQKAASNDFADRPLAAFSIDALHMVGTLSCHHQSWAMLANGKEEIFHVTVGDNVGLNHGKVITIAPDKMEIIEKAESQGQWVMHKSSLALIKAIKDSDIRKEKHNGEK